MLELLRGSLWLPQQIYSGASTHRPQQQATQNLIPALTGLYCKALTKKLNACNCGATAKWWPGEKKKNEAGGRVVQRGLPSSSSSSSMGSWILTSGLRCQSSIQRGAGCGYTKSSTYGGGGVDIERNPIAGEPSIWGGEVEAVGVGGDGGGRRTNKRAGGEIMPGCDCPCSPSACHLSISVGRCGPVT